MFVTVEVRSSFPVPSVYQTGSTEEIEEALALGAYVQAHVHQQRASQETKTILAKKEQELATLKSQHSVTLQQYQQRVADQQDQLTALQQTVAEHQQRLVDATKIARTQEREKTMLDIQDQIRDAEAKAAVAQRRLEAAEERRSLLEATRAQDIQAAEERTRALLQQTLQVREEQVRHASAALAALESAYKSQVDELRSLNDFVRRRNQNVKVKGSEYETQFRDILVRAFGILDGFALIDTNRQGVGHAGDFLMSLHPAKKVLWEVKNYDKPVPKAEVEKFQRDMLENAEVRVGVMVSRLTEITGKAGKGDREIAFVEGKLLIFLSRFETLGEDVGILQSLLPLFQVWWEVCHRQEAEGEEDKVLEDTLKALDHLLADLTRRRQEWRVHRSRLEETLKWMTDHVEDAEERVQAVLRHLQTGHALTDLDVPEGLFRPAHMDEKIRDTIAAILTAYEPAGPSEDVRLADLAETLATQKKVGRETAKKYVLAALLDEAVLAAPGKPTRVRGLRLRAQQN